MRTIRRALRVARTLALGGPAPLLTARRAITRYGAIQRTWELAELVRVVARHRPRVVVEIGTHRGGSLYCWTRAAHPDATLVSIDLPDPAEGLGTVPEDIARLRTELRPGQRLVTIAADSHAAATLAELRSVLGPRPIDLLWIDGDHSDAGVRADWEMYSPLVRPGGLAALHDIHPNPALPGNQVHHLWREVEAAHRTRAVIDQDHQGGGGCGIGIVMM